MKKYENKIVDRIEKIGLSEKKMKGKVYKLVLDIFES